MTEETYQFHDDRALAKLIDHTVLKPETTADQVAQLCKEALQYHFGAVCVNSYNVKQCAELLKGSDVKVGSTVGFPMGAMLPEVKAFETQKAIEAGAQEIDMVINVGALKSGKLDLVKRDIEGVVAEAHKKHVIVKVILETALLTQEEKITGCKIVKEAGADFVKTSTGFYGGGATVEDVKLMRQVVGPEMGVKAAGGIHTRLEVENLLKAGATRIGASAGVKILQEKLG